MSNKTTVTKKGELHGVARFLPILSWLPNYSRSWLIGDFTAALSVWALMVPTSLGYAEISGVPVQHGLYAAAFGMFAFALFTTSRQVALGPGSSTAAVLGHLPRYSSSWPAT
jgi:MFS superfamily sulfate permease-like transporter